MFLILIILAILLASIKYYLYIRRFQKYIGHLKTSKIYKDLPIIGEAYRFIFKTTEQLMQTLIHISEEMESPSLLWLGPVPFIVVSRPDDMKTILLSPNCLQKPYVYNFFRGNTGLFNATTQRWKRDRKYINPTFNNKILQSFVPIFNEKINIAVKNMESYANTGKSFDIQSNIFACTLEMICATTMGYDCQVQNNRNSEFLDSMEKASVVIATRIMNILYHPEFVYRLTNAYRKEVFLYEKLWALPKFIRSVREKEYLSGSYVMEKELNDNDEDTYKTPQIFINELFKLYFSNKIDDITVDDQIATMIAGGTETSAITIATTILLLAMHPDIQERVYNEIRDTYASQTQYSDYDIVTKLNYTEMVLKETMRLFPVGPFLARECLSDTQISNCTIPSGAMILLAFHHLHRNKNVWGEQSHLFNPDNFLPEHVAKRDPYQYLPFSSGPRNCVGIKYGWLVMKIMMAALLRHYQFKTHLKYEDIRTKWNVTLRLVNEHSVEIIKRDPF